MIKSLRKRFIITTASVLFILYALIFVILNVTFIESEIQRSYSMLKRAALEPPTSFSRSFDPSHIVIRPSDSGSVTVTFSQLYIIRLDTSNKIISAITPTGVSVADNTEIQSLVKSAMSRSTDMGRLGNYRYYRDDRSYGNILIIADTQLEDSSSSRLIRTSLTIGAVGLVFLFLATIYLSRFVTKPAEEAFERQRRFISDASHELKTPLSVISVNADVLTSEIGQNKWLGYIKTEAGRMDKLIRQLLDLARLDGGAPPKEKIAFNLSDALYEAVLPFESTAFERKIDFKIDISEDNYIKGDPDGIKQLAAILLDNAFKHTNEGGTVSISLEPHESKIKLEVYNTGDGISPLDLPHVFERFYMGDKSRTGSGSYGLGLAIAQSIVDAHNGKIKVESEHEKWARFTVTLPQ